MCKGRTYGTILVDRLPDRGAATVAAWLRNHPEVEIVTRDRSTEYARGISEGAPTALQVADRWHLLQHLRQMLERLIQRLSPQLKQLPAVTEEEPPTDAQTPLPRTRLRLSPQDKEAMAASRARSEATYQQVQRLRKRGDNMRQIAHKLAMRRTTVRKYFYKYFYAETFPQRAKRLPTPSILDAYLPYLESRHQAGCEDARQLGRELREQGYPGAYVQVSRWLRQRRQAVAPTTPGPYRETVAAAIRERAEQTKPPELPPYKPLAWLLIQEPQKLEPSEIATLRRVCQDTQVEQTYQLAQQFRTLVRQHETSTWEPWLDACAASNVPNLVTFAAGIRQDDAAVRAALTTQWSNGQTEGQVNRLKLLKRQMYGRATFDLLRLRVLHPS